MAEPFQRRQHDPYEGRPGIRAFDDDDAFDHLPAEPEPDPAPEPSRLGRMAAANRHMAAALLLIGGVGATGIVGGRMIDHARMLREQVPNAGAQGALDWSLAAFLVLSGLFMGVAFAGTVSRKAWAWIAIVGLAATLATTFVMTGSMRDQLAAVQTGMSCTPGAVQQRVGGKLTRTAVQICTPAAAPKTGARQR